MSTNRTTTTRIIPVAVAGALGAVGLGAAAHAAEPTPQDLMAQIQDLQAKVQQMEANQQAATTTTTTTTAAAAAPTGEAATVDSVLRDAERRSQLLQDNGGLTGGHEKGKFFLRSADNNFYLNPNAQLQLRYVANFREEAADLDGDGNVIDTDDDQLDDGFEIRRAKIALDGHAWSPDLTFKIQWEAAQNGGDVTLEDAWVRYAFDDEWAVRAGQYKDNVFHEETVSSKRQLAVDRTLVNELLAGGMTDYVQGIALLYDPGNQFRGEFGVHDGANSDNTDFTDEGADWGFSARGEYALSGDGISKAYDDFTAMGNTDDLFVVGGGFDLSQAGDVDAWLHTVDVQWENTNGLALYGAFIGSWIDSDVADGYNWGIVAQVGYMLNHNWEAFGRVDWTSLDEEFVAAGLEDELLELTVGANYYIEGHAAKFTMDLTYLPDGSPSDEEGIGILATEEAEFVFRGQFQLLL
jgi:hypothetical protein